MYANESTILSPYDFGEINKLIEQDKALMGQRIATRKEFCITNGQYFGENAYCNMQNTYGYNFMPAYDNTGEKESPFQSKDIDAPIEIHINEDEEKSSGL